MAFQAFQLPPPGTAGVNAGLDQVNNTLVEMAKEDARRKQQAVENLQRSRQMDLQERQAQHTQTLEDQQAKRLAGEEHIRIADLWKKDPHLAASYVNAIGGKATAEPVYGQAPQQEPLTDDEADFASSLPQNGPDPLEGLMSQSHGQTAPEAPAEPAAPSPAPAPQGPLMGHRLRYTLGGGSDETVLDPLEARQIQDGQEQERVKALDMAGLPPRYRMILMARLSQGEDPKGAWEGITNLMKADDDRSQKSERDKTYEMTAAQKYSVGMAGAAARGASAGNQLTHDEREANAINPEITKATSSFTAKNGPKEQLIHSENAIKKLSQNPNNPVEWVNAVDSMIRTNTGRAAILSQYKLYTGKASGTDDDLHQWAAQFVGEGLSKEKKANLMAALKSSNAELRDQAKSEFDNFRRYDQDPRVARNRSVREHYNAVERNTFGNVPGYGQPAPGEAPNKLVQVARMSPEDKQAIQMAQQRLANDPNDTVAKRVLQLHGM